VMIGTGLLLWANNIAMKHLPKSWLDVATSVHFYEAVLATLAIVVWHFYSIIFDPDVYPLNTAFLTGVTVKKHEHSKESAEPHEVKAAGD
jgi:asparagine N-glycosylation enzyme membrane subunit Stt3